MCKQLLLLTNCHGGPGDSDLAGACCWFDVVKGTGLSGTILKVLAEERPFCVVWGTFWNGEPCLYHFLWDMST